MKKRKFGKKLSRGSGSRKALYRSLVKALVAHGSIKTTKPKAKYVQRKIERIINLAKKDTVAKRRQVYAYLGNDRETTDSIFKKIVPLFRDRKGGYTRIINLPRRVGDNAEMARIEWVKEVVSKGKGESKKKSKTENKGVRKETAAERVKGLRDKIAKKVKK